MATQPAQFAIETLAKTLDMPSALAVMPDGRVLVAEASGRIRVWGHGVLSRALALNDVVTGKDAGLVDVTLHPDFSSNHEVYTVYTAQSGDGGFINRIVRFRELDSVLTAPAVILEDRVTEAPQRTPRIRFGPDRKLYVALSAGVDRSTSQDPGSYLGKILRLNDDGTTPADNPGYSPIISYGHRAPGAFDWQPQTGRLWSSERDWNDREGLRTELSQAQPAYIFGAIIDSTAAAFYRSTAIAGFTDDLFIAGLDGTQIRRVRVDPNHPDRVAGSDPLVEGQFGRISDIGIAADGAIYFCTSNARTASQPTTDRLLRIVPASAQGTAR